MENKMNTATKNLLTWHSLKQLKTIRTRAGDYTQVLERFAVFDNEADRRIGTVHKFSGHSGPTYYDPLHGTTGRRGDGANLKTDGHIQRFDSFDDALAAVCNPVSEDDYKAACNTLAEQIVLMVETDYPADKPMQRGEAGNYLGSSIEDIQEQIDKLLK